MTDIAVLIIRIAVSITMIAFGLHQIVNPKSWSDYLPGRIKQSMTLSHDLFMRLHGVGNAGLGILFIIGFWPFVLTWVVLAWWVFILPFAFYSDWAVGLRDLTIIGSLIAALCLLWPVR